MPCVNRRAALERLRAQVAEGAPDHRRGAAGSRPGVAEARSGAGSLRPGAAPEAMTLPLQHSAQPVTRYRIGHLRPRGLVRSVLCRHLGGRDAPTRRPGHAGRFLRSREGHRAGRRRGHPIRRRRAHATAIRPFTRPGPRRRRRTTWGHCGPSRGIAVADYLRGAPDVVRCDRRGRGHRTGARGRSAHVPLHVRMPIRTPGDRRPTPGRRSVPRTWG